MFDFTEAFDSMLKNNPKLSVKLGMRVLGLVSPFNAHLKARLLKWDNNTCQVTFENHRSVRNHLKGIHAGALFTLGETCAGLLILKSFPFKKYRLILKNANIDYEKQLRGSATGEATITDDIISKAKKGIEAGEPQMIDFKTTIKNDKGEICAVAMTTWQVKSWDQVKLK